MYGGIRLGAIAGVPVLLDWSFFFLAVLLVIPPLVNGGDGGIVALGLLAALSASVLIHEGAHALAASVYRIPSKRVVLTGFGGFVEFLRPPMSRTEENVIAAAGPLSNLATAAVIGSIATLGFSLPGGQTLANVSLAMGVLNLLPAYPLDGGAIARNLIGLKVSDRLALRVTIWIGLVLGGYLVLMGVAAHQFWATFAGIYIVSAAANRRRSLLGQRAGGKPQT